MFLSKLLLRLSAIIFLFSAKVGLGNIFISMLYYLLYNLCRVRIILLFIQIIYINIKVAIILDGMCYDIGNNSNLAKLF
ncbi:hypothetical protein A1OE_1372 [Candidatus Endolissoclinum faulkneri L2]|uniref:Uncharacterized protein n=1 Tax=Candidatus Endolissoclinum faulkneri L2 TaxID=1193729 RepID=K7Z5Z8_9PROT|nr:hypothetical protein A1OE_1372 [Candidatus Endolissoclinum faulkneri L2]